MADGGRSPAGAGAGVAAEGVLVRSTFDDEGQAWEVARRVVDGRLAACAHVQATHSCYRWQGQREEVDEWVLEARTTARLGDALAASIAARHPYAVPMVESWPVHVSPAYAAWMRDVTA